MSFSIKTHRLKSDIISNYVTEMSLGYYKDFN